MTGTDNATTRRDERWKPTPGYEGLYEVSDRGQVRSVDRMIRAGGTNRIAHSRILSGRPMAQFVNPDGYKVVSLSRGGKVQQKFVHRLVALAFLGDPPDGMECCHNNGDPGDARLENLRWDTRSNNALDAVRHGTHTQSRKTHCPNGHAYTPDNTGRSSWPGGRKCRTCFGGSKGSEAGPCNRNKTHCKRGHEFTAENTITRPTGRECRECAAIHRANRRARLAASAMGVSA